MITAGLYGATGYTGAELANLLHAHPDVQLAFATSESAAGQRLSDLVPQTPPLPLIPAAEADPAACDLVFLALPHAASAPTAVAALEADARVIDLSADFRLKDPATYAQWYGLPHPAPDLLGEAVYGLSEIYPDEIAAARLVANPGCYPTSVLLPLEPLLDVTDPGGTIIADCKSGVTGAGRTPKPHLLFGAVAENFKPYSIGVAHRHQPEMQQFTAGRSLIFSPHLLPVQRGILSTIYLPLEPDAGSDAAHERLSEAYANQPFVHVLPPGQLPSLADVQHTNLCLIGITRAGSTLILTSAIDNLQKGAAGQAVQNMNLMFGLDQTTGLKGLPQ